MMRGRGGKRGRGRGGRPVFHSRNHSAARTLFIKKPVYLRDKDDDARRSRPNTPGDLGNKEGEENSYSGSRSSSVTRSSLGPSSQKKKTKKADAGSSSQADASQEYYYGSDFENISDLEEVEGGDGNESDGSESEAHSVYDADELLSDGELSLPSSAGAANQDYVPVSRPPTPVPVWLQDREIPKLELPPSSDDLLIPHQYILQTCAVYEVLRHFRTQIYLSPFTLEDFCAALLASEQSKLLSEVHYQILRLLLRGDEKQQVQFGPQDHKDSINSVLYMCDIVMWPETLRVYIGTHAGRRDKSMLEAIKILENSEYPFVPLEDRLKILQLMTDMVLVTPLVRNEFQRDGPILYDDHCRACQRLGDLLCCETCPATYHLECVVPPMSKVPDHDWQCDVCRKHQLKGVTDCVSDMERNGAMYRQEVLGYDRHGRRYWFLCRRIFVEDPERPGEVTYYSTPAQYTELLSRLDRSDLEDALCMSLQELHFDIERQMRLTMEITTDRLSQGRRSYLHAEDEHIQESRRREEPALAGSTDGSTSTPAMDSTEAVTSGAGSGGGAGDAGVTSGTGDPAAPAGVTSGPGDPTTAAGVTPRGDADTNPTQVAETGEEVQMETRKLAGGHTLMITRTKSGALPVKGDKDKLDEELKDEKTAPLFRLGDASDRTYAEYDNQYSSNPLALNRLQAAEERDKRRHMSHKFSMTQASEFLWKGTETGTRAQLRTTLRHTLQELVSRLPPALMHPSWPQLRRAWNGAVAASSRPADFARALTVLAALIKPRIICTVWTDSLAHVQVQRVTALEREEKKKSEKRERKDNTDDDLTAVRGAGVKYHVKKVRHTVWKQRGEEYRIHGSGGWRWLSTTRRRRAVTVPQGHAAGPHRLNLQTQAWEGRPARSVYLPAADYNRQLALQREEGAPVDRLMIVKLKPGTTEAQSDPDYPADEVPLEWPDVARLLTDGVVDVSSALRTTRRLLFPRMARLGKLDKLLAWREELDRLDRDADDVNSSDDDDMVTSSKRAVVKQEPRTAEEELGEKERRLRVFTRHPCYNSACRERGRQDCYSPDCRRAAVLSAEIAVLRGRLAVKQEVKEEPSSDAGDGVVDASAKVKREPEDTKEKKPVIRSPYMRRPEPETCTEDPFKLTVINRVPKKNYVKYPLFSKFRAGGRWSMLVLPQWELRQLARKRGQKLVDGFNYTAKNNWQVWPYPCPRATFRTGWLYRTCRARSLHAAGLQLRVLWACVRWDDIDSEPQQVAPGEFQITTDTGMVRSLVLKHRDEGRFKERTKYYRRRVTILFDNPVIVEKEYTSSARSGLRKRRRVIENSETPTSAVTEEWVPEGELEIFEIKYYHEKLERQRQERQQAVLAKRAALQQVGSRSNSPANPSSGANPGHDSPGTPKTKSGIVVTGTQLKSRLDEKGRALGKGTKFIVKPSPSSGVTAAVSAANPAAGVTANPATTQRTYSTTRRLITKDGKVIAIQTAPNAGVMAPVSVTVGTAPARAAAPAQVTSAAAAPVSPTKPAAPAVNAATPATPPKPNQIQIIKLPDGKLQVKGLKPGQQLVQLPSGQLQLVSGGTAKSLQAVNRAGCSPASLPLTSGTTPRLNLVTPGSTVAAVTQPQPIVVTPAQAAVPEATSPTQPRTVTKLVTQVVDLHGMDKDQLLAWQQKINEGKAKLALVNGRRVILHNVVVNQAVDGSATSPVKPAAVPAPASTATVAPAPGAESTDEDDPAAVPAVPTTPAPEEQPEVKPEVKSELTPGRQLTATANIVQTPAGPRVVIQGVPTQGLSQSQLHNLQQQVKAELAKGPMLTGLRDIHLVVPADEPESEPEPAAVSAPVTPTSPVRSPPPQRVRSASQRSLLSPRKLPEPTAVSAGEEAPVATAAAAAAAAAAAQDFTVTQEYIQQSITSALNSDNLKPEIAEKLLLLRKKPEPAAVPAAAASDAATATTAAPAAVTGHRKRPKSERPRDPGSARPPKRGRVSGERWVGRALSSPWGRPSIRIQQLTRRKEQLKREILRKRLQMENQLQLQISRQLQAYRQQQLQREQLQKQRKPAKQRRGSGARRLRSKSESESGGGAGKKRRSSSTGTKSAKKPRRDSSAAAATGRDSKKIYCICRQPYDPTKFYVGCDLCSNWFHGSCVGITQRSSKKIKSFTCQQCLSAKANRELFCFCRTEYDESQFYIGCDQCEDWYHGRCVGILPSEGDEIDDYVCPRCDPQAPLNRPNFSALSDSGLSELRRLFKMIKNNKNAWPFIEPVDPDEVPNYYKVIKEPMDLQTIESRLESRHYGRLCDFTGDMIVLLDNCKYFNPPGTRLATCGVNLEAYFRAELKKLRSKL